MARSRLIALAVVCWLALACTPAKNVHGPETSLTGKEVARLLAAPAARVATLQAAGVAKFELLDSTLVAEMLLVVDRQAGMRLDLVSPFGTPILSTIVTPERVILLKFTRNVYVEGPANEDTSEQLLGMTIPPQLLTQVVLGGFVSEAKKWRPAAPNKDDDTTLEYFESGPWRAGLDAEKQRLRKLVRIGDNPVVVSWDSFKDIDGIDLPHEISIERTNERQRLVLKLGNVHINQNVDRDLLRPTPPPGWTVLRIGGTR
ncbi:MAG: lipoprotein insertase outer membrane protein LolB [Candidatus Lernaella stagnicola]|nr:lipoprotein insertase outer membrane protein LolB [Candidatus Lernaella stagnicola]